MPDPSQVAAALPDCRPHDLGAASPRVWEKLKVAVESAVANEPDDARRVALQWALDVGRTRLAHLRAGETVPRRTGSGLRPSRCNGPLRSACETRFCRTEVGHLWRRTDSAGHLGILCSLGVPISEIWGGMSELTCIASTAPAEPTKLGTVGKLLPGMEMRIEADGELLVRGPLVMKGGTAANRQKRPKRSVQTVGFRPETSSRPTQTDTSR